MRTKILKYFGMVVVLIIMVNLTSCELSIESWYDDDDYSEIYYRTTRELCSRTWQETWVQDGEYYTQRLDFYENRTGTDIIRIEHRNGYVTEDRYNFEWRWDNSAQTCIRMVYGPSDISYFENVWLAGNFLKGTLDGVNKISQESGKRKKWDDTLHIIPLSFPNTLLTLNAIYRILISDMPCLKHHTSHNNNRYN